MTERAPVASVVVSTYRRPERCARLLQALNSQTLPAERFEVIVVDNCSGDETSEILARLVPATPYELRPLSTNRNRGPAPARNLGLRASRAPVVAFTDDDCVPEPGWLDAGLRAFDAKPDIGVVQGRTTPPSDLDDARLPRWNHRQDISSPSPQFEACNVFYRRQALVGSGGFDEGLGWWGEDASAGWGVLASGYRRSFAGDAVVVHDVENRPVRWYIRNGFREHNMIRLAAKYPGFRQDAFWRTWSYRREDTAFKLAVAGVLAARKWRPFALLAIPYLWWQRPSIHDPEFLRCCAERVAVDAARSAGQLRGALASRILVL